ncbi:MAG: ferredoxin--NADP reductase [Candidatus Omnitrophota bacterium]
MAREIETTVREIIQRTRNVLSVRVDAGPDTSFRAGQFLCVMFKGGEPCKRWLSISNAPTETGYLEFTKKLTGSDFSERLRALKPGDQLQIQYPFGKFTLEDNLPDLRAKIAFISGGIGITPIRSMCKYIVDKNTGTDIALIYSNRTVDDIAFRDDFELMRKSYGQLAMVHVLCEPSEGFACRLGFIDAQAVREQVPDYLERKFYLCGPPAMVAAMKKMLAVELALSDKSIITENFQGY